MLKRKQCVPAPNLARHQPAPNFHGGNMDGTSVEEAHEEDETTAVLDGYSSLAEAENE